MIKVVTGDQMRNIDKKAIEELNIPGLILMENAGRAVYEQVADIIKDIEDEYVSVLVICGKGNNGGDGFVAARHLIENGIQTAVVSLYEPDDLSGDSLINHNVLGHFVDIFYYEEIGMDTLKDLISVSTVVVDAIFGTGLSSDVKGHLKDVINAVNEFSEGFVVSVDIPSGLDANTGNILGNAVIADNTVTFFAPKLGTIIYPGADLAGEIVLTDIGIPDLLTEDPEYNINLITSNYACVSMPLRPDNSHKGIFGSVFNVAGSLGMTGAAYMSSLASLKVGAGYSVLATPESLVPIISSMAPEIVLYPLKETPNKSISEEGLSSALERSKSCNSFLIGPGIGTDESTVNFVFEFIRKLADRGLTAVVDADGLNCLAAREGFTLPINSVITPHPKELSRILKVSMEDILRDKIKAARETADKYNTIVVLKGARTIICEPNGNIYINPTGSSALSTAGTGDVLSGMIAGFIAQGVDVRDAAILGVYLHGMAGELAANDLTAFGVIASNVIDYIPESMKQLFS